LFLPPAAHHYKNASPSVSWRPLIPLGVKNELFNSYDYFFFFFFFFAMSSNPSFGLFFDPFVFDINQSVNS
jgi:hypothetical protein